MVAGTRNNLFRKAALDRLSSPEQLDRLVPISDTRGWLALTALFMLLSVAVAWGIFGRIPDQVEGKGILVATGGRIVDAMSPAGGSVIRLHVDRNAEVKQGQVIAEIEQTGLQDEYISALETVAERRDERDTRDRMFAAELALKEKNFAEQKRAQQQIIRAARTRADFLKTKIGNLEGLIAKGYTTSDRLEEANVDYNSALQDISAARNRILEIDAEKLDLVSRHTRDLTEIDQRIAEAERKLRETETRRSADARVLAPTSGRITELKVFEGSVVQTGAPVASIATEGEALQAVLYIPTEDGKRIEAGMAVRVSPSSVKKEEHGSILGTVIEVSEFPVTRQGMLTVLQNDDLVTTYSETGAPYAARVNLTADAGTVSGFKWTSGGGPALYVTGGTTIEAEITVREDPPFDLVIPFIRKHTGIGFWSQLSD
jgi:HlyD family secretion protein